LVGVVSAGGGVGLPPGPVGGMKVVGEMRLGKMSRVGMKRVLRMGKVLG
jgi:hypothetical protein